MKKNATSLFLRVLIGIGAGLLLGAILPEVGVRILKTFNVFFAQFLKFMVPLLVLGLVTPAIADVGRGAGKMLLSILGISYISTILAGFFAFGAAKGIFPHILPKGLIDTATAAGNTFKPYFDLKIPAVCDVLTALALAFMIGLGIIALKLELTKKFFEELGGIVKLTIDRVVIPLLPFYILTMICELTASGKAAALAGVFLKVIGTGIVLTIILLIVQYVVAGIIARKNPFKCLWNMLPAYFTAFSICSSSAVIPVTLECTLRNNVSKEIGNLVIPLCSSVHLAGSTIKITASAIAIVLLSGQTPDLAVFTHFILMLGIAAVAAPGVTGGVLMASLGFLDSILGFSPEQIALLMTLYLALDGYGPASNVTGDGAIALVIDRFFGKHSVPPTDHSEMSHETTN